MDDHDAITSRQVEVLTTFAWLTKDKGFSPSIRELGTELGIVSTNGVNDHLRPLVQKGYLTHEPNRARSFVLTAKGRARVDPSLPRPPPTPPPPPEHASVKSAARKALEVLDLLAQHALAKDYSGSIRARVDDARADLRKAGVR